MPSRKGAEAQGMGESHVRDQSVRL